MVLASSQSIPPAEIIEAGAKGGSEKMSLQVAKTFRETFSEYDLNVIYHFKLEAETRGQKRQFVKAVRRNYGGSPPMLVKDTIRKIVQLTEGEFDALMSSIHVH